MPSNRSGTIVAVLVLIGVAVLLYSTVILQQILRGVGVAVSAFVIAAFVYYGGTDRQTLTRATIAVTVVYGVFTLQLPLAVIAACAVYLSAWLTGSDGPLDAPDTEIFPVERTDTDEPEDGD
ncbi:hypothetical protein [Halorubrum sp. FL23]|uniref:hypothetical protein n=1 Tax=Halorubrum sp. FL23 TaxID=3458704 RepID=UPI0040345AFE